MPSMNSQNDIILITGITSYLARETAKKLIKKGYKVFGLTYKESKNLNYVKDIHGLNLIFIDFQNIDINILIKLFKELNSDKTEKSLKGFENHEKLIENIKFLRNKNINILHFAWIGSNSKDRDNEKLQNLSFQYSYKVLLFAKLINAKKFIFMGSQAENTASKYGIYKKKFADFVKDNIKTNKENENSHIDIFYKNLCFIHLKIFSVYGYGMGGNLLLQYLTDIKNNKKYFDLGHCEKEWNFLYIDDFTTIVYEILKNVNTYKEYDIGSEDTRKLKYFILEIKNIFNSKIKLNFGHYKENNEIQVLPDISDLKNDIKNIKFTEFKIGIKRFYNKIKL